MPSTSSTWETRAEGCRKTLQKSFKSEWPLPKDQLPPSSQLNVSSFIETSGRLTQRELEITSFSAAELTSRMAEGSLTAVETVTAFLKRAHVAHQLVNFATEFMVEDALAAAERLDAHFKATGKLVGPLHGIPISAKEHIGFKGRTCHSGYVAWVDNVAEEDALVVRLAKAAGAVFHVRTNEPQSVMHLDCSNPIYGTTVNPHNRKLTSGGSSGGEGASLGLRCAVLGIGTDIGGSVRIPAAFCGSYGLRTTAMRNPYKGVCIPGLGQESIRCVLSPLANTVADLDLFQRTIIDQEPWEEETSLIPLPWKRPGSFGPGSFTVGILWDDGVVHPHPPVTRAMEASVQKLKAAGVKVVDFEPYQHAEAAEIINAMYFPDAAATQREILAEGGEPVAPLTEWAFNYSKSEPLSIRENWELNVRRDALRDGYHRVMKERGVDFILCPAYVGAAARLGEAQYWHYTTIWNMLDQPSVTFPTGLKVDPKVDVIEKDYRPRSEEDEREYKKYTPEEYTEAPIALQLAGKRFHDEDTLAATQVVAGRQRKVKCGEERPACRNCVGCARECIWPTSSDLVDRRFRARRASASVAPRPSSRASSPTSSSSSSGDESSTSIVRFSSKEMPELEHELTHHFLNVYLTVLLLPTVSKLDLGDYGSEMAGLMLRSESVKYAVLANCASNKYMLCRNHQYQKAALVYYLKAMELVNHGLRELGSSQQSPGDSLLTTVVYLYLYNFWGSDTSVDAKNHIDGAISLLNLRYEDRDAPLSMRTPLHRVATESVLYQAFLLAIRKPFEPTFHVDPKFLARSEDVLNAKRLINTLSSESSLVLGLPLRLYRHITDIIDLPNTPFEARKDAVARIGLEMNYWNHQVTAGDDCESSSPQTAGFLTEATTLFVLGASLLYDYMMEASAAATGFPTTGLMEMTEGQRLPSAASPRWQVERAFSILRRPKAYETWTRCYLGAWPMLILGYSVSSEEDVALIRQVLVHMRDRMGYGEIQRILEDVEEV
ncbi:putative amidase [Colletotrichum trifolii]|uniref:amidase n=1 Tax=Colletotrichum trifolii TaxID=5466 RepID=A0A4R8QTX2_COLTR|nr:putative amidase [Colletotrichum trifolii]